jgi:hypothetical protein
MRTLDTVASSMILNGKESYVSSNNQIVSLTMVASEVFLHRIGFIFYVLVATACCPRRASANSSTVAMGSDDPTFECRYDTQVRL